MNLKNIDWRAKAKPLYRSGMKVPRVVRSVLGVVLIAVGVLGGWLPILGFWMAPLGALFIALDVPPWRRKIERWLDPDGEDEESASTDRAVRDVT